MEKQAIRERVWDTLEAEGIARFPFPPHGRIPNFDGAPAAAERLADLPAWREATAIKANPDAPQLPARRAALREGKTVYMAVPRLREEECFVELEPAELADTDAAATVGGMDDYGVRVSPDEMPRVDLVLSGSVAVTEAGERIGKGEGYSDLEFAVLGELGLVDESTTVVTTVHERQVVDDAVETGDHDVPLDVVVTPERTLRTDAAGRPDGIDWSLLDEERVEEIPVLQRFSE
ncbi:5-formyltetrahydrofolate cyclo-ligase [Halomarina oriensis]|uniref:5-formyltetrahydrofolate cyclo-ligase n=1 Tax=Halomarina oriensis TaxID=671145 RepID=A0A6B0GTR0_9EURY|nr:5-formyltetrahydrofolate cyclo-ligase [Halomarina oriensis]MWG35515.1 5-formyltetrahydrofolate cyclo-ligase [Halomarina oriensis]